MLQDVEIYYFKLFEKNYKFEIAVQKITICERNKMDVFKCVLFYFEHCLMVSCLNKEKLKERGSERQKSLHRKVRTSKVSLILSERQKSN
jgi:hypothetical protein